MAVLGIDSEPYKESCYEYDELSEYLKFVKKK